MKNTSDYFIKKISLEKRKFKKRNQNIKLEFFRHFKEKNCQQNSKSMDELIQKIYSVLLPIIDNEKLILILAVGGYGRTS